MKQTLVCGILYASTVFSSTVSAQVIHQETHGDCSPGVVDVRGNISIICTTERKQIEVPRIEGSSRDGDCIRGTGNDLGEMPHFAGEEYHPVLRIPYERYELFYLNLKVSESTINDWKQRCEREDGEKRCWTPLDLREYPIYLPNCNWSGGRAIIISSGDESSIDFGGYRTAGGMWSPPMRIEGYFRVVNRGPTQRQDWWTTTAKAVDPLEFDIRLDR